MTRAIDVANYLIHKAAAEPEPEFLTHLRLQKLLYYTQAWCLTVRGRPLFSEKIEAWRHGPVIRDVYPKFADYGFTEIFPINHIPVPTIVDEQNRNLIDSVWENYKIHSANKLRLMAHSEAPWISARGSRDDEETCESEITHESMKAFFTRQYEQSQIAGAGLDELNAARVRFESGQGIPLVKILDELGMSDALRNRTG